PGHSRSRRGHELTRFGERKVGAAGARATNARTDFDHHRSSSVDRTDGRSHFRRQGGGGGRIRHPCRAAGQGRGNLPHTFGTAVGFELTLWRGQGREASITWSRFSGEHCPHRFERTFERIEDETKNLQGHGPEKSFVAWFAQNYRGMSLALR